MKLREMIRRGLPLCLSVCLTAGLAAPLAHAEGNMAAAPEGEIRAAAPAETFIAAAPADLAPAAPAEDALAADAAPAGEVYAETEPAAQDGSFTTSQDGVDMIKEFEGFQKYAYYDNGKWYIGYGVRCERDAYPDGITEEEGEELLRKSLGDAEALVNRFLRTESVTVNQQQFDALVSMSYNLGSQWIVKGYRLHDYLCDGIEKYTEAEVVNAFATWCHQNGQVLDHVARRRLREAYLFLYGQYENNATKEYTYIHFEANGGSVTNSTVFYKIGGTYGALPVPTRKGWAFDGWYTAAGVKMTGDETVRGAVTLTARWKDANDYSDWVNPYSDVKDSDWYFSYVRELSAKKILSGFPDKTFRADSDVSVGQALKLILLAAGQPNPGNAAKGNWAVPYRDLAEQKGFVDKGSYPDLDAAINRLDIAHIAAKALGIAPRTGESPFTDVDDGYALALYQEGIFTGYVNNGQRTFGPSDPISRGEISAVIVRLNNYRNSTTGGSVGTTTTPDPNKKYVDYYGKKIEVLENVPVCQYNTKLFSKSGSVMTYGDPAYTTAIGVDVSSWQGNVDWEAAAAGGIEFAMIRLGYRGWGASGALVLDTKFKDNLAQARAAGIKVGVYFFSQAVTMAEAEEEAAYVLRQLDGVRLDYPIAFDVETASGYRTEKVDQKTLTDCALAFCKAIERDSRYVPMIYAGKSECYVRLDLSRLVEYDLWYPQYASKPDLYYNYRIWQYTDSGEVPGIKGKADMDIAMLPY